MQTFMKTLPIMGYGMLGIFVVMITICLIILALNKVSGRNAAKKEDKK